MALSPSTFLSANDMEDFATEYLGLQGCEVDQFYESYYGLDSDSLEEEYAKDELNQFDWEY